MEVAEWAEHRGLRAARTEMSCLQAISLRIASDLYSEYLGGTKVWTKAKSLTGFQSYDRSNQLLTRLYH